MKVVLIAALTADGFIGRSSDHLADWTGQADKKLFIEVTKRAGVMVMGSRTFATIGKALPGRRMIVLTSQPELIATPAVEPTSETPLELVTRLRQEGASGLAVCGGSSVYGQFLAAGVVDELYLTIAPVLFGNGVPFLNTPLQANLQLIESSALDTNTVLLHYKVVAKSS